MRIAGFVEESIVDGPGFRIVIFFQGCAHHCYGCHNPETWDFEGGKEVSFDLIKKIIDLYEKFACLHNYHNPNRFFKKVVIK